MIFASISFIFLLFPLYLLVDRILLLLKRGESWRNAWLLIISILFYVWGEAASIFLLIGLGILNYLGALWLEKTKKPKLLLGSLLVINLSILFWYKYAVWVVNSVFDLGNWMYSGMMPEVWDKHIAIPLGISFFTFHAVSYLMDVYRGKVKATRSWLGFLTYFCMFPHLVAGPIVRYAHVEKELQDRNKEKDPNLFSFGLYRFLQGLNKKVLIANSVAVLADMAFTPSIRAELMFCDAWIGIIAYAVQIYFDFSGYSDMAIGLAAMAGFRFEENFMRPYSSSSIKEFWRRWHISLSSWLRDYLYFPLGGSRCSAAKTYRNLLIIFLVCGVWHGACSTFVLWGAWHGCFLVIERLWARFGPQREMPKALGRIYALVVVLIGWVFFRAESISGVGEYLAAMFRFGWETPILIDSFQSAFVLILAVVICLAPDRWVPSPTSATPSAYPFAVYLIQALLALLSIAVLLQGGRNPFIYFNF